MQDLGCLNSIHVTQNKISHVLTFSDCGYACRTWALVFGAVLQLAVLVPTLRHTRVINILGLVGTTYTVWWIVIACGTSNRGIQRPDATA